MTDRLPSSAERRFRALKHDLTLQVFLQDGPFWDEVLGLREQWNIQASVQVPGADASLWPPVLNALESSTEEQQLLTLLKRTWSADIAHLHDRHVPVSSWRGDKRLSELLWASFLANCVLHDPPEMELIGYAATRNSMVVGYGSVDPREIELETWKAPSLPDDSATMIGAPLVHWPDPNALQDVWRWLLNELLAELGRRYLTPIGSDVAAEVETILQETGLSEETMERFAALPLHSLITVDSETTKEDVTSAFRVITATQQERSPGGRPALDRLTAVQCAICKQQGWKDPQIAEHFGWPLRRDAYDKRRRSNVVIDHVKLGRQILASRKNPSE